MAHKSITIEVKVNVPVEKAWIYWTEPKHIINWAHASDDWHSPKAENNLVEGGRFKTLMVAKDGSNGFSFAGTYTQVEEQQIIAYQLDDNRKVKIVFSPIPDGTRIRQTFEVEAENSEEIQRNGWQAILNNFKKYTESN